MVRNFVDGGAAINVMCRSLNIPAVIVDVGVRGPAIAGVENHKIAPGTKNFAVEPAMTRTQAEAVLEVGRSLAVEAGQSFDLTGLGEMGIGNTTTAVALLSAFTGRDASEIAGRGTGAPQEMVDRKIDVVRRAIALHKPAPDDGIGVLAALGGFEIGAIAGFILGAWSRRLPVVLDGFPCCARALVARAIQPDALSACIFAHLSAERGHGVLLNNLGAKPILDLGMRLGEGTGAALAIGIVDAAVRLYREMATFEETGMLCERPGATAR
jgi:nicotinate-nucleotide--dimethylbenzimidazole phosphoribosyltransferase